MANSRNKKPDFKDEMSSVKHDLIEILTTSVIISEVMEEMAEESGCELSFTAHDENNKEISLQEFVMRHRQDVLTVLRKMGITLARIPLPPEATENIQVANSVTVSYDTKQ
ncbi:hypothetical protein ACFBZI_11075 [Moraxella sp. ZJ142]|uniref:hypothetical protein n=1 Tax=Moraxella marmotae TaxID=3344520 RepID=UPI0035D3EE5F